MDFSRSHKIINFSECKKHFFREFWRTRNYYLTEGYDRALAEWYAIGNGIHETLLNMKMDARHNTAFIFHIKVYLRQNNLILPDLAIAHYEYENNNF